MLVVSAEKKSVSSTAGMQTTVATSSLIQHRASAIVPLRMKQMEEAIFKRDFQMFSRLTMQVSLVSRPHEGRGGHLVTLELFNFRNWWCAPILHHAIFIACA